MKSALNHRLARLSALALLLLGSASAHAQACLPGQLDPTFAADSDFGAGLRVLESSFSNFGIGLLLQPDFKLLGSSIRNNDAATQDSELGRFLSQSRLTDNGNLDLDFNTSGTRNTRFFDGSKVSVEGNTTDRVHDLLQLPNGQFMALLSTERGGQSLVLARLNADGSTDSSFGTQGAVHLTRAQLGIPNSGFRDLTLLRQDDGRLLVAIVFSANDDGLILARFNADGSLDTGFAAADADGINGLVILRQSPAPAGPVIRLQNGRPVLMAFDGNQDYSFFAFTAAGAADANFGTNGRARITTNNANFGSVVAQDFVVQPDGRLLFTTRTAALGRLTATGALDLSFGGGDGLVLRDRGGAGGSGARGLNELTGDLRDLEAQRLAVQADGKIIVFGGDIATTQRRFHVARFFANGLPDLGFGDDRIEITPARGAATLPRVESFHRSLLIDPAGRVLFSAHFLGNNGQVAITDGNRQMIGRLCGGESASTRVSDFALNDRTGVAPNSVQTSNIITIAGLPEGQSSLIRVDNGSYSIGCNTTSVGTFIESMEKVVNGDTVCVRHTAAASGTMTTTLTLGGGPDEFSEAFITDTALPEPGTIQFDPATLSVGEGGSMAVLTVTRTGGTAGAINATITATGGTATEGVDFSGNNFSIVFADGESGSKTATVMILNDGIDEPDETVVFTLAERVNPPTVAAKALGAQTTATLTIVDDDEAPAPAPAGTLQFAQANLSVNEAAGTATLTVTRTGGTAGAANAVITVSGGSATLGADFSGDRFSIAFADGEGGSKTATVNLVNDSVVEPDETVIYTLSEAVVAGSPPESKAGNGAKALGSPVTLTLTIVNDDVAPTPTPDPTPTPTPPPVGTPVQATGNSSGGAFGLALLPVLMGMAALRRKLAAAALLAALLPAAQAAAPGDWALRLSAGPTYPSSNSASLQQALNARGHAVTAQQDEDRVGYAIDLEYALSADLSLQASYARLGEAKARVGGTTPNEAQLVRDIAGQLPHFGDLLSLSMLWHLPLFAGIELEPSLGLFVLHGEREGKTAAVRFKDEHTLAGGLLGMGLSGPTGLSPQLRWVSGLRFYGSSDSSALLLFGLEYRWAR
ncbi:MAG: Calx-beta domain-containing protein [Stagnimonas sp.]|nr:Calx-beta domain-containing protein [Stagnimonas sp.]